MLHRRKMVMSAPPLSRLPRLDCSLERRELSEPSRRQATARIRRQFMESRRSCTDAIDDTEDTRSRQVAQLTEYKKYLDSMRLLYDTRLIHNPTTSRGSTECLNEAFKDEVIKSNVPDRLSICVPIRLPQTKPVNMLADSPNTGVPLFQTVKTQIRRNKRPNTGSRHFFIGRDWSSERISLVRFNRHAPELYRRAWIG